MSGGGELKSPTGIDTPGTPAGRCHLIRNTAMGFHLHPNGNAPVRKTGVIKSIAHFTQVHNKSISATLLCSLTFTFFFATNNTSAADAEGALLLWQGPCKREATPPPGREGWVRLAGVGGVAALVPAGGPEAGPPPRHEVPQRAPQRLVCSTPSVNECGIWGTTRVPRSMFLPESSTGSGSPVAFFILFTYTKDSVL